MASTVLREGGMSSLLLREGGMEGGMCASAKPSFLRTQDRAIAYDRFNTYRGTEER